jgi:hypothetical protein
MQAGSETNANACAFNDLALIKIDLVDVAEVNPSVPGVGSSGGVGATEAILGS